MKQRFRATCIALALLALSSSFAAAAAGEGEGPFVIRSVEYSIVGATREMVLRQKAEIRIGQRFEDRASLEAFIADRKQKLLNERVLESVEAEYVAMPATGGGYDVILRFSTKDSWNIIALPKFEFDSNTGLELSVRARDYNFLGSMQALALNLTYTKDEHGTDGFGGSLGFDVPFRLLGHDWSVGFDEDLNLYPDGTPPTSISSLGLGMTFHEAGFPITLTGTQGLSFNPEGIGDDPDPYFLTSSLSLSASVPTGIRTSGLGELSYAPVLSLATNWSFDGPLQYKNREGLTPYFGHTLSWGRADWEGNLRSGMVLSLANSFSYNAYREVLSTYLDASARGYSNHLQRIGLAARATAYQRLSGDERTDQGGYLRGVRDARVDAESALFLNLDLPVKLFDFPTHLLIKKNWLDFELQASPFLDAAVAKRKDAPLGAEDFWYSGGLELIVYPAMMRTFIVRGSVGFDLDAVIRNRSLFDPSPRDGADPYEIYFGLGLSY